MKGRGKPRFSVLHSAHFADAMLCYTLKAGPSTSEETCARLTAILTVVGVVWTWTPGVPVVKRINLNAICKMDFREEIGLSETARKP